MVDDYAAAQFEPTPAVFDQLVVGLLTWNPGTLDRWSSPQARIARMALVSVATQMVGKRVDKLTNTLETRMNASDHEDSCSAKDPSV